MVGESRREDLAAAMRQINEAWLNGQDQGLVSMVHPEIIMVFPNFAGRIQGREGFLDGFRDFCQNATIQEFREHDLQVDVAADTGVVTFRYELVYERSSRRYRSSGRDLWIFQNQGRAWIAVWRAMLEMQESDAEEERTADGL
jgi:hypothetical protein